MEGVLVSDVEGVPVREGRPLTPGSELVFFSFENRGNDMNVALRARGERGLEVPDVAEVAPELNVGRLDLGDDGPKRAGSRSSASDPEEKFSVELEEMFSPLSSAASLLTKLTAPAGAVVRRASSRFADDMGRRLSCYADPGDGLWAGAEV